MQAQLNAHTHMHVREHTQIYADTQTYTHGTHTCTVPFSANNFKEVGMLWAVSNKQICSRAVCFYKQQQMYIQ